MDELLIASADGHTTMPTRLWDQYLEKEHHRHLQRLREEQEMFSGTMEPLRDYRINRDSKAIFDTDGVYDEGLMGVWDRDIRLAQMDREGIATEFLFPGDHHAIQLFFHSSNGTYSWPAMDAGARAFNRWSFDNFSPAGERFLLVGAPLTGLDFDAMLAEAEWMGDHGFTGTFTPGYTALPSQIPLFESHWDPLWAAYAERNITLISHAGWGLPQGFMYGEIESAAAEVRAEGGDIKSMIAKLSQTIFRPNGVFNDLRSRQCMWHLMLGGVFDRHPGLKMMMTEIRADWVPATLRLLDKVWEQNRDRLPAKLPPSEYWQRNFMAGLSFMNKAELAMRHEIGVDTMAFGRDYPHAEATWPNTRAYLSDIMQGIPEAEVRGIMGENMIRFLGLDRSKLAEVASRIKAPTYREVAQGPLLSLQLKEHLDLRCGYSKEGEGDARVAEMSAMLQPDLPRIIAAGSIYA